MTQFRQHQANTILEVEKDYQQSCKIKYYRYRELLIDLIGIAKYMKWVDAFIPDIGPWSECLKLIKAFYNGLVDANEYQSPMKDERPV